MCKLSFLLVYPLLIAFPPSYSQRSIPPEIQEKIDNYIQNVYLPAAGVNGLALTIVQNSGEHGNILYTNGYGWANKEKNIQNGNETQFLIGSVTKSFVSVLVAKLLHETHPELGEAALDTPIHQLLPQANFILNDRFRTEHVTFRDLLSHKVCVFREDIQLAADSLNSTAEIVYGQRYNKEICGFREAFRSHLQYNNQMYTAAGELAGLLAGKPFEDAFQDLLNELGMHNSAFVQKTDDFQQMPFRAMPYYMMDGEQHLMNEDLIKRLKNVNSAGGLFVPPDDMARYLQFHLNLGNLDGVQIVPEDVMKWLTKPSNSYPLLAFQESHDDKVISQFGYGLGLAISSYDGWELIQHGGHWPSYLSQLSLFPAKNLAIFTSTNNGPVNLAEFALHFYILELLNGNENAEVAAMKAVGELKKEEESRKIKNEKGFQKFHAKMMDMAKKSMANQPTDIVGQYGSGSLGNLEIYEKLNEETNQMELYLEYGSWFKGWLVDEMGGAIFSLHFDTDIVQDDLSSTENIPMRLVGYNGATGELFLYQEQFDEYPVVGVFIKNLRSDDLPVIPYEPDSCGPE